MYKNNNNDKLHNTFSSKNDNNRVTHVFYEVNVNNIFSYF